jgi:hypothetical protein
MSALDQFFYLFLDFTTSLILFRGQFCHQVVLAVSRSQLRGWNRNPPYQVQRQSPLNKLMIGALDQKFQIHTLLFYQFFFSNF